ncbi:tetratricopeptide repeat protein [Dolichospermum sp. LEGE 00246]|nr:tetratricopeptide repeat protein [Dolichospermum sp. LEGE 00246]
MNIYNQAIKINPNDSFAYKQRGISRSNLGDEQGAILDFNQAIKINPNDSFAYNWRGTSRSHLGDKQGAIDDYNQAANFLLQQGDMKNYLEVLENIKRIQGR